MTSPLIDLAYNYPLPGPRSAELLSTLTARINADPESATRYLPIEGLPEHVQLAGSWLSLPGYAIEPERVSFGVSGHQLILATLLSLSHPNDTIACDPITYNGWLSIIRHTHRRALAIQGDQHGMLPEALDQAAQKEALWGVFLIPSLHNPCATVMPLERRQEIVEVCERRGLWIIDDDAYRFLNPAAPPSFAHLAPHRTFWIQSLTKPLFAGVKTAFIVSPAQVAPKLHDALRITGHQPSALTLPWVLELLSSGKLELLIAEKRENARIRQSLLADALTGLRYQTTPTSFHAWINLPEGWNSASANTAIRAAGVAVVPGENYTVPGNPPAAAIRVSLAGEADEARVAEGLRIVGQVLSGTL